MSLKPETVYIRFQRRNAPMRGPLSSRKYNANLTEVGNDLSTLATQWNNSIVGLLDALPEDLGNDTLNAFTNGLDGRTLLVNHEATAVLDSAYYNTTQVRPNSVRDQFEKLSTALSELEEHLEGQITSSVPASQVPITDSGALYTATNVETALAEAMNLINTIITALEGEGIM
jgi:hypothetical protein